MSTKTKCLMWISGQTFELEQFSKDWAGQTLDTSNLHGKLDFLESSDGVSVKLSLPTFYCGNFNKFFIKKLEKLTRTRVVVLKEEVRFDGVCKADVEQAVGTLLSLMGGIRRRVKPKHFVNFPVKSDEILCNFKLFKDKVLAMNLDNVEDKIFMPAAKLHLSLSMLCMVDQREIENAATFLEKFCDNLKPFAKQKVLLQGLHCLQEDVTKVHVLYAKPKFVLQELSLQKIADDLDKYFFELGFKKKFVDKVLLHVTLINSKYRNKDERGKYIEEKQIPFNAERILDEFQDFSFGACSFDRLHLSLIGSTATNGDYIHEKIVEIS